MKKTLSFLLPAAACIGITRTMLNMMMKDLMIRIMPVSFGEEVINTMKAASIYP